MESHLKFLVSISLVLASFLSGCGKSHEREKPVLHIYNWSNYFAGGLLEEFEEAFDCEVVYDIFESNEDLFANLNSGYKGYDLVFPSSYFVPTLVEEGLLQKLNTDNMPNLRNLDSAYMAWVTLDKDLEYSVPFMSGTTGIAYRKDFVEDIKPSWSVFDRKDLTGRIAMLENMRETMGAALKSLGYSLNTTDEAQIEEAADVLIRWKKNKARFDNEDYKSGIISKKFWAVYGYGGDIQQEQRKSGDFDIVYMLPDEGFAIWEDTMAIPVGAKNVELAEKLINWLYDPEVTARNIEANFYLVPNSAAYSLLSEEILQNEVVFVPEDKLVKGEQILDIGQHVTKYLKAWTRFKMTK